MIPDVTKTSNTVVMKDRKHELYKKRTGLNKIFYLLQTYSAYLLLKLRVDIVALLFYNSSSMNSRIQTENLELLFIDVLYCTPMWEEQLHVCSSNTLYSL